MRPASVHPAKRWLVPLALSLVTAITLWLSVTRLRISSDLSLLFPTRRESAALTRFTRVFGGGDLGVVLLQGGDEHEVLLAAQGLLVELRDKPSIRRVFDRAPAPQPTDPTLAWIHAGPVAREALKEALTPSGMRDRLLGTRALLLAPGSEWAEEWLARDPLRLSLVPWEKVSELAAGVPVAQGGEFQADEGKARLIVVEPRGRAFDADAAENLVTDFENARDRARAIHPSVSIELTGGHAIAFATATMLKRDMAVSGSLSLVLASIVFVITFRRSRALLAVLPPLILGTLWTTGLAAFFPGGLSAMAIAFAAVVVGVGVDTGVHVYAALLRARRAGLPPLEAARAARTATWRPTLLAALAAGLAFGSLALSDLSALKQLGVLCGVGEVFTAIAILLVTPEIGALLERGTPPPPHVPAWRDAVMRLTASRARAWGVFVFVATTLVMVAVLGWPKAGSALVAIRPHGLAPLATQKRIYELFGGKPGQWIVLSEDSVLERARSRADAIAETLDVLQKSGAVEGYDALASFAPSEATAKARLAARDALDLPHLRGALEKSLSDTGFDLDACAPALEAFSHPVAWTSSLEAFPSAANWIVARHLGQDEGGTVAATFVRPAGDPAKDARAVAAITQADPEAIVTGYPRLEHALQETLAHDLPRVAIMALVLVGATLRAILGSTRDVATALVTVVAEIAGVALLMRVLGVPWHVYDALVLPVLVGVTIDEAMFLIHASRETKAVGESADVAIRRALDEQGALVVATALTTAAGFAALLACRFDGLFDLGEVGVLGVLLGLVAALVVVPAGLRLGAREHGARARDRVSLPGDNDP
jgi:predicted RND superfamily exporter protein